MQISRLLFAIVTYKERVVVVCSGMILFVKNLTILKYYSNFNMLNNELK